MRGAYNREFDRPLRTSSARTLQDMRWLRPAQFDMAVSEDISGPMTGTGDNGLSRVETNSEKPQRTPDTGAPDRRWSIGELAVDVGVSTRTIRFYETSGLITPERAKGARIYSRRDRARMHLILRGKNLGFTLEDIREYLGLYDDDPNQVTQTTLLVQKVDSAIDGLEKKRIDLERTLGELKMIKERAEAFLAGKATPLAGQ
jgi:DNA-binding transcriptional MerR regulator